MLGEAFQMLPALRRAETMPAGLPAAVLTNHVCAYLDFLDVIRLAQTCRPLRELLVSRTLEPVVALWPVGDCSVEPPRLGRDLAATMLIDRRGIPGHLRHRFAAQSTDLGTVFAPCVARELALRSGNTQGVTLKFRHPFKPSEIQSARSAPCDFPAKIKQALLEELPAELTTEMAAAAGVDLTEVRGQRVADYAEMGDADEWLRKFVLASRLSRDYRGLTGALRLSMMQEPYLSHHLSPLADAVFEYLITQVELEDSLLDEIRRDLGRTLPNNYLLRASTRNDFLDALMNVLKAVAIVEPGMGYCQGMNFIVGVYLLETLCPATAFWCLLAMIRQQNFSGLFCPGVPTLKVKMLQFRRLVHALCPRVRECLARCSLSTDLVASQFFVTAFAYFLPGPLLIRFWDATIVGGWRVLMTLGVALVALMEPELLDGTGDMASALSVIQNFRLKSSGNNFESDRLYKEFHHIWSRVTPERLENYSVEHFVQCLKVAIRSLVLPASQHARPSPKRELQEDQQPLTSAATSDKATSKTPPAPATSVRPPYLLVPRCLPATKRPYRQCTDAEEAVRAVIINYFTEKSAKSFQLYPAVCEGSPSTTALPGPLPDAESTSLSTSVPSRPTMSWSLLAGCDQQSPETLNRLQMVRGKGMLPLAGFYVIIDARSFLLECPPTAADGDPLTRYLFPQPQRPQFSEQLARFGNLADLEIVAAGLSSQKHRGSTGRGSSKSASQSNPETAHAARRCQSAAYELMHWILAHNEDEVWTEGMRRHRGGFIVAPLKAIIQAKIAIDQTGEQAHYDRSIFEEKISGVGKYLRTKTKELDKLRAKESQLTEAGSQLTTERQVLTRELEAASPAPACSVSPQPKPGGNGLWTRLLPTWIGRTGRAEAAPPANRLRSASTYYARTSTSESRFCSEPPTGGRKSVRFQGVDTTSVHPEIVPWAELAGTTTPSETENLDPPRESPPILKSVNKLEKKLKYAERCYKANRSQLQQVFDRIKVLEDAIREAEEIKATLTASYHELTTRQENEELALVEDILRHWCDWSVDSLPLALLRIAGIVDDDNSHSELLEDVPELHAELLMLPSFKEQFEVLFRTTG